MQDRVEFTNDKGRKLVGILHTSKEKIEKIVFIAHGFCANKDRERLVQIADLYAEKGISALRFDFGGSGESYDTEINIESQVDDLLSVIKFVKSEGYK